MAVRMLTKDGVKRNRYGTAMGQILRILVLTTN